MVVATSTGLAENHKMLVYAGEDAKLHNEQLAVYLKKRVFLNKYINKHMGNLVVDGFFSGMILNDGPGFENTDFAAKLLGYYEAEVQSALSLLAGIPYRNIVNVGAGDGFYAVGLARQFSNASVIGYEMNHAIIPALRRAAELNHVADRIQIKGECTSETLNQDCVGGMHLVVMDCEGGEEVLIPALNPAIRADSHFLIEIHDRPGADVGADMMACLASTHRLLMFSQGARDPNKYEAMRQLTEMDRWQVVCEMRGVTMRWLLALPYGHVPPPLRSLMGE